MVGKFYQTVDKSKKRAKKSILRKCKKIKFQHKRCNECVVISKKACGRTYGRKWATDLSWCVDLKSKKCGKRKKSIRKMAKRLAVVTEPKRCKKPRKTKSKKKSVKARYARSFKRYKKCNSIKRAFTKQKKSKAFYQKKCKANCSRCIEECLKPNEQVFDAKGKCREPRLREKIIKPSARAKIVRDLK